MMKGPSLIAMALVLLMTHSASAQASRSKKRRPTKIASTQLTSQQTEQLQKTLEDLDQAISYWRLAHKPSSALKLMLMGGWEEEVDQFIASLPHGGKRTFLQASWNALLSAHILYDCWEKNVVTPGALRIIDNYWSDRRMVRSLYFASVQLLEVADQNLRAAKRAR